MSTTATHTPGPWKVGFGGMDGDDYAAITSPFAEHPICQLEPRGYVKENAHLIAAAPDMLEALEAALALINEHADELAGFEHPDRINAVCDAAAAAIGKAKGCV